MRDPLLVPAVLVIAGILVGKLLDFRTSESSWPLVVFFLLTILSWRRARWLRGVAGTCAMLFAGVFVQAIHRPTPTPELDAGAREIVVLEGCVVEPTVFSRDRARFTLELEPGARARVSLPIEDDLPPQRLEYGQRVELEARVRAPHNFGNPGAFDNAGYLARSKIYWTAFMPRRAVAKILEGRCGWRFAAWVFRLRTTLLDRIESLYPGDDYAVGMMQGVLLGETSKLERAWTENFRRTGSFHALVISGVHVSVLAGVLLFLLRFLPVSQMAALGITAACAWLYAMLAGFSPPVVRAAAGFSLFLGARFFFRQTRIMNLLSAITLGYLAFDPDALFDASFQLSFLSVAALGALAAPLIEATSAPYGRGCRHIANMNLDLTLAPKVAQWRVEMRLTAETLSLWTRIPLRWATGLLAISARGALFLYELFAISAVIQVGLALPMIEYFHRLSFTGLTSNLLIVPAMNGVIPIGFLATFTGWKWVAAIARWLLSFSAGVADWHARLDPGWRYADPPLWLAGGFVISMLLVVMFIRRKWALWPVLAVLAAMFALLIRQPWPAQVLPGTLELTAIDVGQGDSLLVVFPHGATMLVDGGGILSYGSHRPPSFDIGEEVVSPYLWSREIRRLDVIVATHAHEDHIGGIPALLANFRPKELWTGANPSPELLAQARKLGVRVVEQREAPAFDYSGARLEIIAPAADYESRKPGNNDSLAFRVEYGARSFLLTADLERPVEGRLLAEDRLRHADVLKVGHHGSKTSTTESFLEAVSPSLALISAGYENSFGHPHPDVVERLVAHHTAILRTDQGGLATVRTDGVRLWFDTEQWHRAENFNIFAKFPVLEGLLQ